MAAAVVRRWLSTRNVIVQNEWLEACINFVKDDNQGRPLSTSQLNELVYEQWLMAEIQVSTNPCLPQGLCNAEVSKLDGIFCLQINSIINVGESAYSQIQKMKGQDDPEDLNYKKNPSEARIKPSRMLLLELTDGVQTVFGMEYQIIPSLKVTTPPGAKVVVSGQVSCRMGTLLLTASNIKVLGGDVMQLSEENSFWNVLHHAIGQDPVEKPGKIKSEPLCVEDSSANQMDIHYEGNSTTTLNNRRPLIKTEVRTQNVSTASASINNNNRTQNVGNSSTYGGRTNQALQKNGRAQSGAAGTSNRDRRSWGLNSKTGNESNQDLFGNDDDDDLMAAIADEDYFGLDEEFDVEQLNQLEQDMQTTETGTVQKIPADTAVIIHSSEEFENPNEDEPFEDDFPADFLPEGEISLSEIVDSLEMKPLYQRIRSEERTGTTHQSKKPKISHNASSSHTSTNQIERDSSRNQTNVNLSTYRGIKSEPTTSANASSFSSYSVHTKKERTSQLNGSQFFNSSSTGNSVIEAKYSIQSNSSNIDHNIHSAATVVQGQVKAACSVNMFGTAVSRPNQQQKPLSYSARLLALKRQGAAQSNSVPFVYLSHVLRNLPVEEQVVVRVKAYVVTLVSHSQTVTSNWIVTVKLNDGSDTVDADLSEKVLTELLGFPVAEFQREMEEAKKTRNLTLCQKLQRKTELFQRNLAFTSCLMYLQFSPDTPRPRVLQLVQPTSTDLSGMLRRVCTKLSRNDHV